MNDIQLQRMHTGKGFIAALDQSGGSTPKALKLYGIAEDAYHNDEEMFDLMHQMRARIITSPSFSSEYILGAILFEMTMDRKIEGKFTADYLWEEKRIVPILKVDKGVVEEQNGVQLMNPISELDDLLARAKERHIFGTKMRSVVKHANEQGIKDLVAQQFEVGIKIAKAGLVPILEPEVDIQSEDKAKSEEILLRESMAQLAVLEPDVKVMFKVSIPTVDGFYTELENDPHVVRVVALSGGYSRKEACERLALNPGLIASFSRAFTEGLSVGQSDAEFNKTLHDSAKEIYDASIA